MFNSLGNSPSTPTSFSTSLNTSFFCSPDSNGSPIATRKRLLSEVTTTTTINISGRDMTLYGYNPLEADHERIKAKKAKQHFKDSCGTINFLTLKEALDLTKEEWLPGSFDDDYQELENATVRLFRFVINAEGKLKCGINDDRELYSHEQLAGGEGRGVFAAGEFGIDSQGVLRYVNNRTGHYRVPATVIQDVVIPHLKKMMDEEEGLPKIETLYIQNINAEFDQEELKEISLATVTTDAAGLTSNLSPALR